MGKSDVIPRAATKKLHDLLLKHESQLLGAWMKRQLGATTLRPDLISESSLRDESRRFLETFRRALQSHDLSDVDSSAWADVRGLLDGLAVTRARQGFSPRETATFVFSLKEPLFELLRSELDDPTRAAEEIWNVSVLLDQLGLYAVESYQKGREQLIGRQQQELLELSTPVVTLWSDVLALPLIGTLDSNRTQIVMESLLERIVESGARIAIIDITGVPTVDTLVAQHLLKTVAAARLMGAECIISGIRPQIAQTIVHLGVDLGNIATKSSLADAFALALARTNRRVVSNGVHGSNGKAMTLESGARHGEAAS